jgi:hypothetical protein
LYNRQTTGLAGGRIISVLPVEQRRHTIEHFGIVVSHLGDSPFGTNGFIELATRVVAKRFVANVGPS